MYMSIAMLSMMNRPALHSTVFDSFTRINEQIYQLNLVRKNHSDCLFIYRCRLDVPQYTELIESLEKVVLDKSTWVSKFLGLIVVLER